MSIGQPGSVDALGGVGWRQYQQAEALFQVWGPSPESAWEPYHCVPLFAALDHLKTGSGWPTQPNEAWPTAPELATRIEVPPHLDATTRGEALGQAWAAAGVWVILDLPGVESVTLAPRLVRSGYQPVCTFDHWPHPQGLLKPERILAQLLRFAPVMAEARRTLEVNGPPLWICDRERLGVQPGKPRDFDNRYFLDDSLLPGPEALRRAGIHHIVCLVPEPTSPPLEDLHAYFDALRKEGFTEIHGAALSDHKLRTFEFAPRAMPSRFAGKGYQRSASGGFGRLIPEQSASGG